MERIETHNHKSHSIRNLVISTALASVIGFSTSSCDGKTTQKDINEQRERVELYSFNIKHYIDTRKKLVNNYNRTLNSPKTESNQYEIDNILCLLEEQIEDYDEKIKDLIEDKLDAEVTLNEMISDRGSAGVHTEIDSNKWDFLLTDN